MGAVLVKIFFKQILFFKQKKNLGIIRRPIVIIFINRSCVIFITYLQKKTNARLKTKT